MTVKKSYTRNLSELESLKAYPIRVVEEYFDITDIDIVSKRFFSYLYETDYRIDIFDETSLIKGKAPQLRKTNFIDLMNQEIEDEHREAYFIFADVSDFADYSCYVSFPNNNKGTVYYTDNKNINEVYTVSDISNLSYNGVDNLLLHNTKGIGNPKLSGRGTISIDMEQENTGKIYYKLRVATIPHFIKWAYIVSKYIVTGTYNTNLEI